MCQATPAVDLQLFTFLGSTISTDLAMKRLQTTSQRKSFTAEEIATAKVAEWAAMNQKQKTALLVMPIKHCFLVL